MWGEPAAPLNLGGTTVHKTSFRGSVGVAVAVIVLLFSYSRSHKMINKIKSSVYQMDTGLDLFSPNQTQFSQADMNQTIGIGAY